MSGRSGATKPPTDVETVARLDERWEVIEATADLMAQAGPLKKSFNRRGGLKLPVSYCRTADNYVLKMLKDKLDQEGGNT